MRKASILTVIAALTAVSATGLRAQQVAERQGLYFDAGVNYTWPSITITTAAGPTTTGKSSDIGYTAGLGFGLKNNMVRIGAQYDYFVKNDFSGFSGLKSTTQFITGAITFYPTSEKNTLTEAVWLKLNVGYGTEGLSGAGSSGSGGGFAWGVALGKDIMTSGGKLAISPSISWLNLTGTGDFGGDFSGDQVKSNAQLLQIGITIGYKH